MRQRPCKTVLLIEDRREGSCPIEEMFRHQGSYAFELACVSTIESAVAYLAAQSVDVILLYLELPGSEGQAAVRALRQVALHMPIVLLVKTENESTAMLAMQDGVQDYLLSGEVEGHELMRALRNAVERKRLEETMFRQEERAQVTLNSIGDAVICTDLEGNISFLNPVAESLTGWSLQEAIGRPLAEVLRIMDATTHVETRNPLDKAVVQNRTGSIPANCILVRRDQHEVYIEDSVAPIHDRYGLVDGAVIVFRDASVARALAAQIEHLAEHDALTGLPNRMLLNDRIGQGIAQQKRRKGNLAVLFLDLDGFKHVNDSLGHPAGDKLLQSVAKRLEDCVRLPDTVSRQGGDEFVVLLLDVNDPEDVAVIARRILKSVEEIQSVEQHDLHITASIGVSVYPDDGQTPDVLIRNADTAMYQAKEGGRNRYRFYKPEMNVRAVERQSVEEDLRRALLRHEFLLHYQPIMNLATGEISGVEALIRWRHPGQGMIPPLRFIPIAEDSGLILPIGAWILREACKQAKAWTDAGLPAITMSVNVSAVQFESEGFVDELFVLLDETGLEGRQLELEITESVLMKHPEQAALVLRTLRERGIRMSVDDFGTGYSSLSYLRKFSLDALKIDQTFVREITRSSDDAALVQAIISMARSLKLEVIAEGVETMEELEFLKAEGCEEAQGYLFSRPVRAEEFAVQLERHVAMMAQARRIVAGENNRLEDEQDPCF